MKYKDLVIDGNNFNNLDEFYDEIELKLTKGLDWKIGRNLDSFNDVLRGGFGMHEINEQINLRWINSKRSKETLGRDETFKYIKNKLNNCHPSNIQYIEGEFENFKNGLGKNLFEIIVGMIKRHNHVSLVLE